MSYHIISKIRIDGDKVFITGADNNVWPRTPSEWECTYVEDYKKHGYPSIEVAILDGYEQGTFQGRANKYTRALEVLRSMPEYSRFDWRGDWDGTKDNRDNKKQELYALMQKCFTIRLPSKSFAITKEADEETVYMNYRRNSRYANWWREPKDATLFRTQEEAEQVKKGFRNSEDWQIIKLTK